jgi:tripeptide aminopeptidase
MSASPVDERRALAHLMDLLRLDGLSGHERPVADAIREKLLAAGCKPAWLRYDKAHRRIGGDFEIGNLILRVPGTHRGGRRLFMGHMDKVPLCRGAVPKRKGRRIVSSGDTALGGDNRTACAALVTMVETLLREQLPHPPLTVLFTVGEEIGLLGARHVRLEDLGRPEMGFNVDGGNPARIVTGAIGADRWRAEVHGRSSHAGVAPEEGISAALIASRAIAEVARRGYFGLVRKRHGRGTSNVGTLRGGEASNQVTDHVLVVGESRSHDAAFIDEITGVYRAAFSKAAAGVCDHRGRPGRVEFHAERDYDAFHMDEQSAPVEIALASARRLRLRPTTVIANGGLDANYLNAMGVPTVTLGAGQHKPHTVDEYVDVREYVNGCRLLTAISTA